MLLKALGCTAALLALSLVGCGSDTATEEAEADARKRPRPTAPTPEPTPTTPTTPTAPTTCPSTLRDAALARGVPFVGYGFGAPYNAEDPAIAARHFNTFRLEQYPGEFWKGPGVYDLSAADWNVSWASSRPEWAYIGPQLVYGQFIGQGNNILVPAWLRGPDSATGYGTPTRTPAQLSEDIHDLVVTYVRRFPGMRQLEITNELVLNPDNDFYYVNSDIGRAGGKTVAQYVDTLCRWAKAVNPSLYLILNDAGNEGTLAGKYEGFYDLARTLKAMGTPLEGLGFQGHLTTDHPYDWAAIARNVRTFADLGYDIHITEFGVRTITDGSGYVDLDTQRYQAGHMASYVDAFLAGAGSRLKSITTWGVRDRAPSGGQFDPGGLLWDPSSRVKEGFHAVMDTLGNGCHTML